MSQDEPAVPAAPANEPRQEKPPLAAAEPSPEAVEAPGADPGTKPQPAAESEPNAEIGKSASADSAFGHGKHRKFKNAADVAFGIEKAISLTLRGAIDRQTFSALVGALRVLGQMLPKSTGAASPEISTIMRERARTDPGLLDDLSGLLSDEQLQALMEGIRNE